MKYLKAHDIFLAMSSSWEHSQFLNQGVGRLQQNSQFQDVSIQKVIAVQKNSYEKNLSDLKSYTKSVHEQRGLWGNLMASTAAVLSFGFQSKKSVVWIESYVCWSCIHLNSKRKLCRLPAQSKDHQLSHIFLKREENTNCF